MDSAVFLVHHDKNIRRSARRALELAGHVVEEYSELSAMLPRVEESRPDVLVVPWISENSAREWLARLKHANRGSRNRIIVLAPDGRMRTAIGALEYGADDCLATPFSHEELTARVNACLRRAPVTVEPAHLEAGPVTLDKSAHTVTVARRAVELAPTEFRLLAFFLENQGRVFGREELLRRAWAEHIKAGPRTVDVHVRRLRKILEPFGCDHMIQTVRGFGYRFSAGSAKRRSRQGEGSLSASAGHP
jgi:two-component system phosphate regulon response regulator PhoB